MAPTDAAAMRLLYPTLGRAEPRLYHYTSLANLPRILEAGFIDVTNPSTSPRRELDAPEVVWLTANWRPGRFKLVTDGHELIDYSRTAVRFTVSVPEQETIPWEEFARTWGESEVVIRTMTTNGHVRRWRVIERPIPATEWVEVRDMRTDELIPLDTRGGPQGASQCKRVTEQ
ncbi:hypothetical protein [uncultured Phycicoccus sp.]|uniref:hypothetical protein n=1 Tax=uncultured Phycicoccus sp. TaxID=661422 RepID=UPI002617A624|nr:hypothetical protein [uncultured Phycicoccus sp.]